MPTTPQLQYRVRTAEGWLWIESHGMVTERDATGRPLRLMDTHADIGKRKRVEEAGVQASRATSATRCTPRSTPNRKAGST